MSMVNIACVHVLFRFFLSNCVYYESCTHFSFICMIIQGLNAMSSNSKALLQLLDELSIKIAGCKDPFTSLDIGLCLYGLKGQ